MSIRRPLPVRYVIPLIASFMYSAILHAQDTLFYTNGTHITGTVEEIGVDQVRYRTSSGDQQVLVVVERKDLHRIKLGAGQEFDLHSAEIENALPAEVLRKTHALKLDFIAPGLNHAVIGYEHVLRPGVNAELKLGWIGLGNYGWYEDYSGGLVKLGVKFITRYSFNRVATPREYHPLAGLYLRPELMFSTWYSHPFGDPTRGDTYNNLALHLTIGYQTLISRSFVFDLFGGLGYGAQWLPSGEILNGSSNNAYRQNYAFSHAFLGNYTPLSISGGMMFGYIF